MKTIYTQQLASISVPCSFPQCTKHVVVLFSRSTQAAVQFTNLYFGSHITYPTPQPRYTPHQPTTGTCIIHIHIGGYIVLAKFGYLLHHSVTLLARLYERFSIHTLSESNTVRLSWLCSVVHVQLKCISF